jgi:hypothetical protein
MLAIPGKCPIKGEGDRQAHLEEVRLPARYGEAGHGNSPVKQAEMIADELAVKS